MAKEGVDFTKIKNKVDLMYRQYLECIERINNTGEGLQGDDRVSFMGMFIHVHIFTASICHSSFFAMPLASSYTEKVPTLR